MKQNDIIIPLKKSKDNYQDLKFCLRSVEKYVENYRDVWIIGDLPPWIQNVKNIPFSDATHKQWKEKNILDKIQACCINRSITEDMFFFNDDFVILDKMDATDYPYYYKGTCSDSHQSNKGNTYQITMYHTMKFLEDRGFKDLNFDIHTPIIYNKKKFMSTFAIGDIDFKTKYGYGIKTLYCSVNKVKPVFMEDCKIGNGRSREEILEAIEGRSIFSYNDFALRGELKDVLTELFPNRSKFEK